MKPTLTALSWLWLAAAPLGAQEEPSPAAAFDEGYLAAQSLGAAGQWRAARRAWTTLLEEHAGAEYVRPRLPDIRQSLRRATFWEGRKEPAPEQLVAGKIHRYDRSSSRLRIEYDPASLADFDHVQSTYMHPVVFRRKYTLEVRGTPDELAGQAFFVATHGRQAYGVVLGSKPEDSVTYTRHQLLRIDGEDSDSVDRQEPEEHDARKARSIKVKISVTESAVTVTYDGRKILSARKEDDALGGFGIGQLPGRKLAFDKLVVDGTVESAWLDSLVDAAVQEEWDAFESSYAPPAVFSAWGEVTARPAGTRDPGELAAMIPMPRERFTRQELEAAEGIADLLGKGKPQEAIEALLALDADYPPATRELLLGMAWLNQRRYAAALRHVEASAGDASRPYELRRLTALLLQWTEERARAIEELEQLVAERPDDPGLFADLASLHLREGRPSVARTWIDRGLAVSPGDAELVQLRGQIVKATQGPAWKEPFDVETDRFLVVSDLDPRICRVAARELDEALAHYEQALGALPAELGPSRVFLFSGEAGYLRYVEGVRDDSPENTAGLYSPTLKQVLAWNQPSRAQLFRVLRHEAMHRYMDLRLGEAPRWFAEGVAECFAIARQEDDSWKLGAVHPEHADYLRRARGQTIPLETFLWLDDENFVANAELCYAQAWAFTDFLLTSSEDTRALFDRLWGALEQRTDDNTALDEAFGGTDLEQLEADFAEHVRTLLAR